MVTRAQKLEAKSRGRAWAEDRLRDDPNYRVFDRKWIDAPGIHPDVVDEYTYLVSVAAAHWFGLGTREITHLTCEVCGGSTPLREAMASLAGGRIVHTCADAECLSRARQPW